MAKKTRKVSEKAEKGMTIPQLRKAFDHIEAFVASKGKQGVTDELVRSFRKEWKKFFHKDVSEAAAKEYLNFVIQEKASQKGGGQQAMTPAALGYDMQAGANIPYGNFPRYIDSGFGFANKDSLISTCGQPNNLPTATPAGLGSNAFQKGGRRATRRVRKQQGGAASLASAAAEFLTRPFGSSSPLSTTQSAQMVAKGVNSLASPRPEINDLPFTQSPKTLNATIQTITRTV